MKKKISSLRAKRSNLGDRHAPLGLAMTVLLGFLNLAAVYQERDPIGETQTNPVGYNDKMEEIKQGVKEAPKPSFQLIPKEKFMIDSNLELEKKAEEYAETQPILGEDLPLDVHEDAQDLIEQEESALTSHENEAIDPQVENRENFSQEETGSEEASQEEILEEESGQDDWWSTEESSDSSEENQPEEPPQN